MHATFKLPIGVIDVRTFVPAERLSRLVQEATRIVIDEISMVRADILDAIDATLRRVHGNNLPFGGVQIIMVGDFLQLPPVVMDQDRSTLEALGYETPYAFHALSLRGRSLRVAAMTKVWRQKDPHMIAALGDIREGRNIHEAVSWFNQRCVRPHREGRTPLLLTAKRKDAERHNQAGLDNLKSKSGGTLCENVFEARASGGFTVTDAILPAPERLTIMPGQRVMAVRNDPKGEFMNGSLGTVMSYRTTFDAGSPPYVRVLFDGSDQAVKIEPFLWEKSRQDLINPVVDSAGTYEQVPLTYGYAITIHKSQGLSLDDVRIDLGSGAFAAGQLYVALSRARSIEGLSLTSPITTKDVRIDDLLVSFLAWADGNSNLSFSK
jgi:hypothetical protein